MAGESRWTARDAIVLAVIAASVALLTIGGIAGAAKNPRKLPRGPYPSLGKCQVFPKTKVSAGSPSLPNESAWRQDISNAPVDPNSAGYMAYIAAHGGDQLVPYFGSERRQGFPYAVVGRHQRHYRVQWVGHTIPRGPRAPIPARALVEAGQFDDGDRHVIAVDRHRCRLFELFASYFRPGHHPHWDSSGGAIWDLRKRTPHPSGQGAADASGLPMFAGLVRYDEVRRGAIHHAFRVSLTGTQRARILPALDCASAIRDSNAPPMGLRLRLRASYDLSGIGGQARVIAEALKHYGLIVADNGENWFFSGTSDRRWNNEDLNQLTQIPGSAFEVVKSAAPVQAC